MPSGERTQTDADAREKDGGILHGLQHEGARVGRIEPIHWFCIQHWAHKLVHRENAHKDNDEQKLHGDTHAAADRTLLNHVKASGIHATGQNDTVGHEIGRLRAGCEFGKYGLEEEFKA